MHLLLLALICEWVLFKARIVLCLQLNVARLNASKGVFIDFHPPIWLNKRFGAFHSLGPEKRAKNRRSFQYIPTDKIKITRIVCSFCFIFITYFAEHRRLSTSTAVITVIYRTFLHEDENVTKLNGKKKKQNYHKRITRAAQRRNVLYCAYWHWQWAECELNSNNGLKTVNKSKRKRKSKEKKKTVGWVISMT